MRGEKKDTAKKSQIIWDNLNDILLSNRRGLVGLVNYFQLKYMYNCTYQYIPGMFCADMAVASEV